MPPRRGNRAWHFGASGTPRAGAEVRAVGAASAGVRLGVQALADSLATGSDERMAGLTGGYPDFGLLYL